MSGDARLPWVGQRAVAWVIDDAPVPADLAWTLIVIARRCDDNGRGSYQSTATIARKAGKSEKQAQRDIVRLRQLGLLRLGDQTLVEHLPPGQRPTVYDVPLDLKGSKPVKESRNPGGGKKGPGETPPMDGTPPLQGTPPMDGVGTPPMDAPGTPPMQGDQRKPLNNPLNNPPLSRSVPDSRSAHVEDRERDEDFSKTNPRHGDLIDTVVTTYLAAYRTAATPATNLTGRAIGAVGARIAREAEQLRDKNVPHRQLLDLAAEAGRSQVGLFDLLNASAPDNIEDPRDMNLSQQRQETMTP